MKSRNFNNVKIGKLFKDVMSNHNFSKFLIFGIFWNFALSLSSPYFNLYMLKNLKMSFFDIALYVQIVSNLATILSVRFLGRLIDRFGNKPVLIMSSTIVSFLPFLWCFTTPDKWLFFVLMVQILSGIFWPGIDLTFNNLLLYLSPNENRSFYIAVYNFFIGIVNAISYILGGYITEYIAPTVITFINQLLGTHLVEYHLIFILSGICRFTFSRIFLPKIQEERSKPVDEMREHIFQRFRYKI